MKQTLGLYNTNKAKSATTLTLEKPSDIQVGDMLIIVVGNDSSSSVGFSGSSVPGFNAATISGDTNVDAYLGFYWRIADGSENVSQSVSNPSGSNIWGIYTSVKGMKQGSHDGAGAITNDATGTYHVINGAGRTPTRCCFCVFAYDGGDTDFSISGTGWTGADTTEILVYTGTSLTDACGGMVFSTSPESSVRDCTIITSTSDGLTGFQLAWEEGVELPPTEVRATLFDADGNVYPNGTVVYSYENNGDKYIDGEVGSISGAYIDFPPTDVGVGEVVFRKPNGDLSPLFLAVAPETDDFGLVTNLITPNQLS